MEEGLTVGICAGRLPAVLDVLCGPAHAGILGRAELPRARRPELVI